MFGRKEEFVLIPFYRMYNFMIKGMFLKDCLFDKKLRGFMHANRAFMNKYKGERCYILGNGPSLNSMDLSNLKDKYVFSVNFLMKSELFDLIKPTFHVMIDPAIFNGTLSCFDSDVELIKNAHSRSNETQYFVPYYGIDEFKKMCPKCKVNIVYCNKEFLPYLLDKISLADAMPSFSNVVLMCLYIAVFMGFTEIVLLGVDMTNFIGSMYGENVQEKKYGHIYGNNVLQIEKKKRYTNEFYLKTYSKVFEQFRYFAEFCEASDIKVYNASQSGLLDVFPIIDLVAFERN